MSAAPTLPAALVWVPRSSGAARWYETACGRFSLSKGHRRGEYTLTDRHTADACCPQYRRMETCYSVAGGKAKAARWARGGN